MINKQLDKIDLNDINELKDNGVNENKTIEYKRKLPTNSDLDKKEFLADISSFANASGGDLIFGVGEEKGLPVSIDGIEINDIDEEIRKYENIIRDGIEPRIIVNSHSIKISEKRYILIYRIGRTWTGPHRVIFGGHDKFYSRNSAGKYPLDTYELKIAFNLSQTLIDQISKFKTERISQIFSGNLPIPFYEGGKVVLHLIPLESFMPNIRVNLKLLKEPKYKFMPISSSGWSDRINLEGLLRFTAGQNDKSFTYVQLYRNGIIEAVSSLDLGFNNEQKRLCSAEYEADLIKSLRRYLILMKDLSINVPIVFYITFVNVKGYTMATSGLRQLWYTTQPPIDREVLQLPEVIIESYDISPKDILLPIFDLVWNACGFERSLNFNEVGVWIHQNIRLDD